MSMSCDLWIYLNPVAILTSICILNDIWKTLADCYRILYVSNSYRYSNARWCCLKTTKQRHIYIVLSGDVRNNSLLLCMQYDKDSNHAQINQMAISASVISNIIVKYHLMKAKPIQMYE